MEILTSSQSPSRPDETTGQAGFSLLELLVALPILGFVALSIVGALDYGMILNGTSRDYTTASNLAKSHLEELAALPFTAPQLTSDTVHNEVTDDGLFSIGYFVRDFAISGSDSDPAAVFAGTSVAVGGFANVKIITVSVSALGTAPGIRSVTVEAVKQIR
jgi:prepilin-type N-terminal cleavage/methylation domain-containing protein